MLAQVTLFGHVELFAIDDLSLLFFKLHIDSKSLDNFKISVGMSLRFHSSR